jgi:hypothetical protein
MPIAQYRCKHCKTVFDIRADALVCEKSHLGITRTRVLRYVKGPYPFLIEAEFRDGEKRTYIQENEYWRR